MRLVQLPILNAVYMCLYVSVPSVTALRCYFCADNGVHDKCGNYSTYLEARMLGPHSPFLRNCSAGNDNICYIETYKSAAGSIVSDIRDCSDGLMFSFSTLEHQEKYRRLRELSVTNRTRCVYDGLNLLCLSKCITDLCNGLQIDKDFLTANGQSGYSLMTVIIIALVCISLQRLR